MGLHLDEPIHSLKDIEKLIQKHDDFIIYGYSSVGVKVKKMLLDKGKSVISYIDFDSDLSVIIDDDTPVYRPDETDLKNNIIVIASFHEMEISKRLSSEYGLTYFKNYVFFDHILMSENPLFENGFGKDFYTCYQKNSKDFDSAQNILADKKSKDIFNKILKFRNYMFNPEKVELDELPTPLSVQYDFEGSAQQYIDAIHESVEDSVRASVAFKISSNPYSYENKISLQNRKTVLNLGAYNNSSIMFSYFSPNAQVYAFDIQEEIYNENKRYSEQYKNIIPILAGVSNVSGEMSFAINHKEFGGTTTSALDKNGANKVKVYAIDDFVKEYNIPNIDFIKMDVEGAELLALEGARELIKNTGPDLALSAYHQPDHLFKIPLLLKELNPDYSIYIGHDWYNPTETVCFATLNKG